jgi:mannose-6-phosphate isomerase-like protein (cupin superfamily)
VPVPLVGDESIFVIEPVRGWTGRLFHSTSMTFGHWEIAEDAADLHEHHHAQEEVWNVVSGEIALTIDGHEHRLRAGDAAIVPRGVPHSARILGGCRAIVVDHPVRDELPTRHRI